MDVVRADSSDLWRGYTAAHEAANVGLRVEWREVIEGSYGLHTHYLAAVDDGQYVGVLPLYEQRTMLWGKVLVSIPFCAYGGLLADTPDASSALLSEARELGQAVKARYIELRQPVPTGQHLPTRANNVAVRSKLYDDTEVALRNVNRRARRELRKCDQHGLTVQFGHEHLSRFHSLYLARMHELGVPTHGLGFFARVQEAFGDDLWIGVVESGNEVVAGGVCIRWLDVCNFLWASAVPTVGKCSPNYQLYWAFMERARRQGLAWFDMGRAEKGSGILAFKANWRGEMRDLLWEYVAVRRQVPDDAEVVTASQRLAMGIWRALPLRMASALGPLACRRVPIL